mmetsp:Transcript_40019/g.123650  ORF Transcript_40019/g.123650 Transcript_40019/m.123650 type:complete len:201 (-) Transcript_40019:232-834(-)
MVITASSAIFVRSPLAIGASDTSPRSGFSTKVKSRFESSCGASPKTTFFIISFVASSKATLHMVMSSSSVSAYSRAVWLVSPAMRNMLITSLNVAVSKVLAQYAACALRFASSFATAATFSFLYASICSAVETLRPRLIRSLRPQMASCVSSRSFSRRRTSKSVASTPLATSARVLALLIASFIVAGFDAGAFIPFRISA